VAIFDAVRALHTSGLQYRLGPTAPRVSDLMVQLAIMSEGINASAPESYLDLAFATQASQGQ